MVEQLIDFEWPVHHRGYAWSFRLPIHSGDHASFSGPYLVSGGDQSLLGGYADTDEYCPLDDRRALFRKFAKTPPTFDGIRSFANEFGRLGIATVSVPTTDDLEPVIWRSTGGEPFAKWVTHIEEMRLVLLLWRIVKGKEHRIPKVVPVIARQLASVTGNSWVQLLMESLSGTRPSRREAEDALYDVINAFLRQHSKWTPQFDRLHIWKRDGGIFAKVVGEPAWDDPQAFRPRLRIAPSSLLGALWFQLARAVAGNVEFGTCRQCGTWFEVDHSSTRSSRAFCSEPCRSRAYRGRIAEAQRLYAGGLPIPDIAIRLESSEATVAGWIVKSPRGPRAASARRR